MEQQHKQQTKKCRSHEEAEQWLDTLSRTVQVLGCTQSETATGVHVTVTYLED